MVFFESHFSFGNKLPYYCYIPSAEFKDGQNLFMLALIFNETDAINSSCSIITMEATNFFSEVHNLNKQMPLVLDDSIIQNWLNTDLNENGIRSILKVGLQKRSLKLILFQKKYI